MQGIPLQHRKFRQVPAASFARAKAFAKLEYSGIAGGQNPFHAELGRRLQKPAVRRKGFDMFFGSGRGDAQGGFHFQKALLQEAPAKALGEFGSEPQGLRLARQAKRIFLPERTQNG